MEQLDRSYKTYY